MSLVFQNPDHQILMPTCGSELILNMKGNFILMDEPTALLDPLSRKQILNIIKSLIQNKTYPKTVLWITHRLDELVYADKVSVMKMGSLSSWQEPKKFKI